MSSQPVPRLANLPSELLLCVAEFLPDVASILNLMLTCRRMATELTMELYRKDIESGLCEALAWGCEHDDMPALLQTLDAGANIDHQFWNVILSASSVIPSLGQLDLATPLYIAIRQGNLRIARFLLDQGARATRPHLGGPLLNSTIAHYYDEPSFKAVDELPNMVERLLEKGANPHYTGTRPCPLAVTMIAPAPIKVMRLLFDYGANPAGTSQLQGSRRIWEEALRGSETGELALQKFRFLLQNCRVNELIDETGDGILQSLVRQCMRNRLQYLGHSAYLEVLLAGEIDVNSRSRITGRPILRDLAEDMLWYAVPWNIPAGHTTPPTTADNPSFGPRRDSFLIAQNLFIRLLTAGAIPEIQDPVINGLVRLLPFLIQIEWDASEAVMALLRHGAPPRVVDDDGRGLLHHACMVVNPKIAVVDALLRSGLNPNTADHQGRTALHALLGCPGNRESRKEVYKLLVGNTPRGVDVNARDEDGFTARDLGRRYYNVNWRA